jgi:Zn-finger nucleic acid-binding protein
MVCSQCGGLWVPGGDVSSIGEQEMLAALMGTGDPPAVDTGACLCPEGHGLLLRARVELEPPFSLDRCDHCRGIWFDRGEWDVLAQNYLLEHLDDLWTAAWQRQQRREQTRRSYFERCRQRFGDDLFDALTGVAEALQGHPRRAEALAFLHEMSGGDDDD